MSKTKVYELSFNHDGHSDAGLSFDFRCPKCGDSITIAEHPWWKSKCSCGREWQLNIFAETKWDE